MGLAKDPDRHMGRMLHPMLRPMLRLIPRQCI